MLFTTSDKKQYDLGPAVWQKWVSVTQMLATCGYHEQCKTASQAGAETPEKHIVAPLIVVPSAVLDLVLRFSDLENSHSATVWPPADDTEYDLWRSMPEAGYEAEFMSVLADADLFRVYMAADYLDYKHLTDTCARALACITRADAERYARALADVRDEGGNIPPRLAEQA